ncbi:MAG: hypothetical protein HY710_03055, partial [Candidatus Latescibacteria bacterium]|nr:hypothetical protein [Candidatus Latescibacterota bacterium]
TGYETVAYFSKFSGWFGGQVYWDSRSPGFDTNDLGFMNRADRIQSGAHVYAQIQQPWALARRSGFNVNVWSHWNFDRINLKKGINFNNWHELKNYWWFNFGISRDFEAMDDLVTRGGPVMANPASIWYWSNLSTDSRKRISGGVSSFGSRAQAGRSWARNVNVWATIRPASYVQIDLSPGYSTEKNFAQWVTNVDTDGDGRNDRFVFGELRSQVLDITARATVSFTPDLSLQFYMQPFVAAGDYGAIKALARPASYEFIPYAGLNFNPDFHRRSLRSNMVMRWEYRPGSTLFLVWSQSRSASSPDPSFRPWQSLGDSLSDDGSNIFLVKMSYWLNM